MSYITKKNAQNKATETEKILNRELHETTLNHRFAFYLEMNLINESITNYNVDIEYNRNFGNSKSVIIETLDIPIRPDILIHKRMSKDFDKHLLVVEAKKGKTSQHDIDKIKGLINDERYFYSFGLTVSYASDANNIVGKLYYKGDSNNITSEDLIVKRKKIEIKH